MLVRLFVPEWRGNGAEWVCRFEIGAPISHAMDIHGTTSLQALALALKGLSTDLYGSGIYRDGELGIHGELGGYLAIPAPNVFLDVAPFPF